MLLTTLRENAVFETLGSALALAGLSRDKNPQSSVVCEFVSKAPLSYRTYFISTLLSDGLVSLTCPRWVAKIAVDLLAANCWFDLPSGAIQAATSILSMNLPAFRLCMAELGTSEAVTEILSHSLISRSFGDARGTKSAISEDYCGLIAVRRFKPERQLQWVNWSEDVWTMSETCTGYFRSIFDVFRLARRRSNEELLQLRSGLGGRYSVGQLLPSPILAFLAGNLGVLDSAPSEPTVDMVLEKDRPGWERMMYSFVSDSNGMEWEKIILDPYWLLYLISVDFDRSTEKVGKFVEFSRESGRGVVIANNIIGSGLIMQDVGAWGSLFDQKFSFAATLREYVLDNAADPVSSEEPTNRFAPLKLSLPREAELLPHVLAAMITGTIYYEKYRSDELPHRARLAKLAAHCVPAKEALPEIWNDKSVSQRARAAALVTSSLLSGTLSTERARSFFLSLRTARPIGCSLQLATLYLTAWSAATRQLWMASADC